MTTATPERKWALTKIAAGDYLLPSNDSTTVWRIATYIEGPSSGLDLPNDKTFWGVWRWTDKFEVVDTEWDDRWVMDGGCHDTRADAIDEAMRLA